MAIETFGLSIILFLIGALGFIIRRNVIVVFMSVQLMLNACNLAFVAFARQQLDMAGHAYVFIIMIVAISEMAVGLAIALLIFRTNKTVNLDEINLMKG